MVGRLSQQDTQKGRTSHPPNPGASRRAFSQARPQRATQDSSSKLACLLYPKDGPDEFPTARIFLTRPPTGTPRRAISPGEGGPISFISREGSGQGCPLLRASNEHIPIVRVLRARRAPGRSLPILLRPRVARAQGTHRANPPPADGLFQHPASGHRGHTNHAAHLLPPGQADPAARA